VALQVQTVLQAQRTELLFAQFARQAAANLVGVLRDPFIDDGLVVLIVLVHSGTPVFALHAALRLRRAKISAFASTVERSLSDRPLIC
jgi:hypothetical protein